MTLLVVEATKVQQRTKYKMKVKLISMQRNWCYNFDVLTCSLISSDSFFLCYSHPSNI